MFERYSIPRLVSVGTVCLLFLVGCGGGGGGAQSDNGGAAAFTWLIPADEVVDGGPGKDGIPAIDEPKFDNADTVDIGKIRPNEFVVVLREGSLVKAYPHDVMNWHEVVNDGSANNPFTMSYCPLTGSALAWKDSNSTSRSFGVSGLLHNSNLILYDRATDSRWSQMLQQSVWGSRAGEVPERIQVIEMLFGTLLKMYPSARVMTRDTGWERTYDIYPYGPYLRDEGLLFPVSRVDGRLHPKTRVKGIRSGTTRTVYQIDSFGPMTAAINDQVGDLSIVAVGNSTRNFAAIYDRVLSDGTILTFSPIQDDLPNIMNDDEGNVWDIFGSAVSGPRAGQQLDMTNSFTSLWFAWAAFFPDTEIHFN
jgi:hypothetical protein